MAISVRIRFEVFKRDEFTCQYCGRKSPDVVLEVDHIVPRCNGGLDDPINLRTSCWDCNHGKAGVPLESVVTGEDPHDRAVLILEQERTLAEYNQVVARERARRDAEAWELWRYWRSEQGFTRKRELEKAPRLDFRWLSNALSFCPREQIRLFMDLAIAKGMTQNLKWVGACVRNWRAEQTEPAMPVVTAADEQAVYEYTREMAIEEVMVALREAAYGRRQRGRCNHAHECGSYAECLIRQTYIQLGLNAKAGQVMGII